MGTTTTQYWLLWSAEYIVVVLYAQFAFILLFILLTTLSGSLPYSGPVGFASENQFLWNLAPEKGLVHNTIFGNFFVFPRSSNSLAPKRLICMVILFNAEISQYLGLCRIKTKLAGKTFYSHLSYLSLAIKTYKCQINWLFSW
jgi:hypothetical protein